MSKPSKKTSGYPSAPKSFVSHLLTRSSGQPAPIPLAACVLGVFVLTTDAVGDTDCGQYLAWTAEEPSVDELWVAEVIDIRLSAADAVRAT
eukprot:contig_33642_g8121